MKIVLKINVGELVLVKFLSEWRVELPFLSISLTLASSSSSFFFQAIISSACLRLSRSFFSRSVKYL